MFKKIFSLLWSTKVALVLLVLIFLSCVVGVFLPPSVGKEAVFSSLWFNLLLVLLTINTVFCIINRVKFLHLSKLGTTIFHLGLVLLFVGVVYDQLFFFEGQIHLTEGETLSCAERDSYDLVKLGRFFQADKLKKLGDIYLDKVYIPYVEQGKERGIANGIAVGEDIQEGRKQMISVARPFKYKGFEFFRAEKDGYSPLFVMRDTRGKVIYGAYAALQSIKQQDGTYLYRSGRASLPESFVFPETPDRAPVFKLQTVYHPDKDKKMTGDVSFQVWGVKPDSKKASKELFNGRAAFRERIKAGDYFLSMDEVRYWTSINVVYRPGLGLIFGSFWVAFGGLILSLTRKAVQVRKDSTLTAEYDADFGDMVKLENEA